MELKASKEIEIRFSEVDMMGVVWHGSYALYFEDAREAFGAKYDLSYMGYVDHGFYAPISIVRHPQRRSSSTMRSTTRPTKV